MESLERKLRQHHQNLVDELGRYTDDYDSLVKERWQRLVETVDRVVAEEERGVAQLVDTAKDEIKDGWTKVNDWKEALGEPAVDVLNFPGKDKPLLAQIASVNEYLDSMRSRIEERGEAVVRAQRVLMTHSEILGTTFLNVKLENIDDGWESLDLRAERLAELERAVAKCEREISERKKKLDDYAKDICGLRSDMGLNLGDTEDGKINMVSIEDNSSLYDSFDSLVLLHLGIGPNDESVDFEEIVPTAENVARAQHRLQRLEKEKEARNQVIQQVYDKLYPLWTMMGISEEEMDNFTSSWMGSSLFAVQAYQEEYVRMEEIKKQNISVFIESERETIAQLWNALYMSDSQREASFPSFFIPIHGSITYDDATGEEIMNISDNVSEDLLFAHENVRKELQERLESMRPVLDKIKRYFDLVQEMRDLEASSSDPTRLLGKRGDPGRLLREEKARKRVAKEKPKLENELLRYIPLWEEETGEEFIVNGRRFIEDLGEQIRGEAQERDRRIKRGRGGAASATSTPSLRPQATGRSAAAPLKRDNTGASTASHPHKRQALQAAHTGNGHTSVAAPLVATATGYNYQQKYNGALSDIGNRKQPVTRLRAAAQKTQTKIQKPMIVPSATGMRLPSGWGKEAAYSKGLGLSSQTMSATGLASHNSGLGHSRAQPGFRPRPSMNPVASIMNR